MDTNSLGRPTLHSAFERSAHEGRIALMPFLMAGDPDLETTGKVLLKLEESGADVIELGIPYSDPLADGPVIQAAASRALRAETTPLKVLEMLSSLKGKLNIPVVLFTYSNPLLNRGMKRFCSEAANAGAVGLVVPDLPLEEASILSPIASSFGIDLVLLVAPTTPIERMKRISEESKGFTYLVSVTGVTGERSGLEERVRILVRQLKETCLGPVVIGFGISGPDHISQVRSWGVDGAIVGSALVKRMANAPKGSIVKEAGDFCCKLREAAG